MTKKISVKRSLWLRLCVSGIRPDKDALGRDGFPTRQDVGFSLRPTFNSIRAICAIRGNP